jgi:type IV pilus assembly protein PilN
LTIQGKALSFGDINDFVLALQNSPLLKGEATKLTQAQLEESTQAAQPLATYQLQTDISDIPASKLLLELNRKGATGLVTRIQSLKEKGVLKP